MNGQGRRITRLVALSIVLGLGVIGTTVLRVRSNNDTPTITPEVLGATSTIDSIGTPVQHLPPTLNEPSNEPYIQAKAVYLLDVDSAYPLYANNESAVVPIASVTKLMTAVVTRKLYKMDDIVTVSKTAESTIGSHIELRAGEQITVNSLLTGLLIQSGNDAAMALAEHIGSETEFVATMNEQAAFLGMKDTVFKDPAGLNDEGHSTAKDLGILAAYVLRDSVIRDIVRTSTTTIQSVDNKFSHKLETSNRLIKNDHPLYMSQVTGLKTGFTPDAGHCLVASAKHQGKELVSVVLHTGAQTPEASATETRKLFSWAFEVYHWTQ